MNSRQKQLSQISHHNIRPGNPIQNQSTNHHLLLSHIIVSKLCHLALQDTTNSLLAPCPPTQCPPAMKQHVHLPPKTLSNTTESLIVNFSKQSLTETEKSVLELGLTFCPSQKNLNKEQLALDLFNFICRLKLREHFFHNPSQPQSTGDEDKTVNQEDERPNLPWKDTNPHWYPNEVKFNRSEGLLHFIQNIINDLKNKFEKERK